MRILDHIEFLISEAFTALRRNSWMTFAAITTCCMALFLTGGVGFAYKGVNEYAAQLPTKFEIRAFFKDELSEKDAESAVDRLKKIPYASSVKFITKAKAWEKFKLDNPTYPTVGIDNPLPDSITVVLANVENSEAVVAAIQKDPAVAKDGVVYLKKERDLIAQTLNFLRLIGLALGGLMLITSGVLIYNAIRMTIVARRKEFRIMELVGATRSTVIIPLLIEGIIQGGVGGILASFLVLGGHSSLSHLLKDVNGIIQMGELPAPVVFRLLISMGGLYGLLCSMIAVRRPKEGQRL